MSEHFFKLSSLTSKLLFLFLYILVIFSVFCFLCVQSHWRKEHDQNGGHHTHTITWSLSGYWTSEWKQIEVLSHRAWVSTFSVDRLGNSDPIGHVITWCPEYLLIRMNRTHYNKKKQAVLLDSVRITAMSFTNNCMPHCIGVEHCTLLDRGRIFSLWEIHFANHFLFVPIGVLYWKIG